MTGDALSPARGQIDRIESLISAAPRRALPEVAKVMDSVTGMDYVLHLLTKLADNIENVNRQHMDRP